MTDRFAIKTIWFSPSVMGRREKHVTFIERDEAQMNWADTISDIRTGQVENVVQVIQFNEAEHTCADVTEMAARAIVDICGEDREYPAGSLLDFLEGALGCRFMADLHREMEAA